MKNARHEASRFALLLAGSVVLTACTLLLNSDVEDQCSTDADCAGRGAGFAGTVCTQQHVCTSRTAVNDGGNTSDADTGTCATNKECIDRNGGQPWACRKSDKHCVSLLSRTCDRYYAQKADLESDEAVYIGFMSAGRTGNTASVGLQEEAAAELAQREIARGTAGLPPEGPGKPRRPYVLISCDEIADSAASVAYLVNEIQVPAIIGPALSNNFINATATTIAKDILILSTTASSPLIAGLEKKGLVYSVNPSDALAANGWIKKLPDIQTRLESNGSVATANRMKVMVIQRGDGLGIGLGTVLTNGLRFNNGRTAAQNADDGLYEVFNYGDPFDKVNNPNPNQKYSEAVTRILAFQPHVIIGAGTTEIPEAIMVPAERDWANTNYRPFYFGPRALETPALTTLMQGSEEDGGSKKSFKNRIITTGFGVAGSAIYSNFQLRYKAEFTDPSTVAPSQYAAQGYDATYLMAYAIVAAGSGPLTGSKLSAGLLKTQPGGEKVDIGPDTASRAFIDLANGKTIDINGASGPLDFNQATGTSVTDVQLRCPNVDGTGKPIGFKDSTQYLSAATSELVGTANCSP